MQNWCLFVTYEGIQYQLVGVKQQVCHALDDGNCKNLAFFACGFCIARQCLNLTHDVEVSLELTVTFNTTTDKDALMCRAWQ
jgi:hypothetical protein